MLNIPVPHTTALLGPAPDTILPTRKSSHHTLHFLSSYSSPFWSLKCLYPLAHPHVSRLSLLVFDGRMEIFQVSDSVAFISRSKLCLSVLPEGYFQSLSHGVCPSKGLLSVKMSQRSNPHCPLGYLLIFLKALFWLTLYFLQYKEVLDPSAILK